MFDWIVGLFVLALVVLIWAALGHGIWVLCATVARAVFGIREEHPRTKCPSCGAARGVERGICRFCFTAAPTTTPPPTLDEELSSFLRQLDRLWRSNVLSDEEHARIASVVERDLNQLRGGITLIRQEATAADAAEVTVPAEEVFEAEIVEEPSVFVSPPPVMTAAVAVAEVHPLDRVDPPNAANRPSPAQPHRVKRALADVLIGFMQERNIRWGELVSGLLIVGSTAGLVLSLRDQLREWIPYFPAFLFLLATAAIHAAGLYTLRKWNLQSTSRGVLLISMLLVPLNFLAAILISGDSAERFPIYSVTYIVAVTIGLLSFGVICFTGARALVGRWWPMLALAVWGTSTTQLVVHRTITEATTTDQALTLGALTTGCFIVAIVGVLQSVRHYRRLTYRRAQPLLMMLGLGSFALAIPLSLIFGRSDSLWKTMATMSPIMALLGATVAAAGVMLATRARSRVVAPLAATGASIAVLGGFVMLAAVGFAWPEPVALMIVGMLCAVALLALAWTNNLPILQAPAVACATLSAVVGLHFWQGSLAVEDQYLSQAILHSWRMGRTGLLLTALSAVVAGIAGLQSRWRARDFAAVLRVCALALLVISAGNAVLAGFFDGPDASFATIVFAAGAVGLAAYTCIQPQRYITCGSVLLLFAAVVHAVGFNESVRAWLTANLLLADRPVLLATLSMSCLCAFFSAMVAVLSKTGQVTREITRPLAISAVVISLSAAPFVFWVHNQHYGDHAVYVFAIALTWLLSAAVLRSPQMMTIAQGLTLAGAGYLAVAIAQRQVWFGEWTYDPRAAAMVIAVIAVACMVIAVIRRYCSRWPAAAHLLAPPWPSADRGTLAVLVAGAFFACTLNICGCVVDELRLLPEGLGVPQLQYLATFEHPLVWLALMAVTAALSVALWDRIETMGIASVWLLMIVGSELFSLSFAESRAVASALRWSLMACLGSGTLVIVARHWLITALRVLAIGRSEDGRHGKAIIGIALVLAGTAVPILGITSLACASAAAGITPRGPVAGTFFAQAGWTISYVVPLAVVLLSLLAFCVRERMIGFAVAAGLVWQYLVSLGVVMPALTSGASWDEVLTLRLWQFNAVALGVYSLLTLALRPWLGDRPSVERFLKGHTTLAVAVTTALALWATLEIFGNAPLNWNGPALNFGSWHSYAALALVAGALGWLRFGYGWRESVALATILAAGAMSIVAASFSPLDATWPWTSYHVLLTGWLLTALGAGIMRIRTHAWASTCTCTTLLVVIAALSFFHGWSDPNPIWATLIDVGALAVVITMGIALRSAGFAFASIPLVLLATAQAYQHFVPSTNHDLVDFVTANLAATISMCGLWLAVEIDRERHRLTAPTSPWTASVPLALTPVLTLLTVAFVAVGWVARAWSPFMTFAYYASAPTSIAVMLLLGAYLFACLWFERQRTAIACLYLWGIGIVVVICDRVPRLDGWNFVALPTLLAGYVALTGWVWISAARLARYGQQMGIRDPIRGLERTSLWLPFVTVAWAAVVCVSGLGFVLSDNVAAVRYVAAFGPILCAFGIATLAQQSRRATMIYLSLTCVTFAAALLGWAELPPGFHDSLWLRRAIRLLLVLGSLAILYAAVLPRLASNWADWMAALRRVAGTCSAFYGAALLVVLLLEIRSFAQGRPTGITSGEVAVVAVILLMMAAALVFVAVAKDVDLKLSIQQRMGCVYGAQLLIALTVAHLYFTRPEWFDGLLRHYWPYIVVAIAFIGVAIGEWLQRWKDDIIAQPLRRTGVFLPLLPALGWWIEAARGTPTTDYALVMFAVGLLYVVVSIIRPSILSAVAAGFAGNVALWSLLSEREFAFFERPQFWLIPPALSVLAGVQAYQKRLSAEQLVAARYACLLVIYLSSTSEIFIGGLSSFWPPLVLLALAIAGVLAGIAMQIRAFLYLGTSFVFLSIVTMVWHASRAFNEVWPWWVFGICTGLAMLVLFGLFEKKRNEISLLAQRLRQWDR